MDGRLFKLLNVGLERAKAEKQSLSTERDQRHNHRPRLGRFFLTSSFEMETKTESF